MERPTSIYLIRHGQTTINAEHKLSGFTDPPLTDLGRRQAEGLGGMLADVQLDVLYTSPMERTVDTAAPLAEAHGRKARRLDGLKEQNFGAWEGKSFTEIFKLIPGGPENLLRGPFLARFPEDEGTESFVARVMTTWRDEVLPGNDGKTIALVTHSGVIVILLCHFLGIDPFGNFFRIRVDNGSATLVERYGLGLYHFRYINRLPYLAQD